MKIYSDLHILLGYMHNCIQYLGGSWAIVVIL
jgi:hypothetical protein